MQASRARPTFISYFVPALTLTMFNLVKLHYIDISSSLHFYKNLHHLHTFISSSTFTPNLHHLTPIIISLSTFTPNLHHLTPVFRHLSTFTYKLHLRRLNLWEMAFESQVCSAKRKKVQTLDNCFRLLALISRVQHNFSLALLGSSTHW